MQLSIFVTRHGEVKQAILDAIKGYSGPISRLEGGTNVTPTPNMFKTLKLAYPQHSNLATPWTDDELTQAGLQIFHDFTDEILDADNFRPGRRLVHGDDLDNLRTIAIILGEIDDAIKSLPQAQRHI